MAFQNNFPSATSSIAFNGALDLPKEGIVTLYGYLHCISSKVLYAYGAVLSLMLALSEDLKAMFALAKYAIKYLALLVMCFSMTASGDSLLTRDAASIGPDVDQFSLSDGDAWMEGYTLIRTNATSLEEAYQVVDLISAHNGHVGVIISPQLMLGWVPRESIQALLGKADIRAIDQDPVTDTLSSREEEAALDFFNDVVSGVYQSQTARGPVKGFMLPDVRAPGRISRADYLANLKAAGISLDTLSENGISFAPGAPAPSPGNSDYMVGKVSFNVMFVESIAPQNDYTWTAADRITIQNEITAGLSWWSNTAQNTHKTPLTFVTSFFYDSRTNTNYEPIRYKSSQDNLWINQIMAKFGYSSGDKFARTTAFNTARRIATKTNWSVVSFVAYNPSPASSTFTDGYFAYAYLRGPYSQLLFRNNGWAVSSYDVVNAHETGHLFGAQDEYYQAGYGGCTSCGVSTNGVINGNCQYCNPNSISAMMRNNVWSLSGYTPGQIGWASLKNLSVKTYSHAGALKEFFVPGEKIKYQVYFCLTGPRLGTRTHTLKVRFRGDFFSGTINAPGNVSDDTGWTTAGTGAPPKATGLSCYVAWWNRTVPTTAQFGPATATAQVTVADYGKGAQSATSRFFVAPYGTKTEVAPRPSGDTFIQDSLIDLMDEGEGPFLEAAALP